ncbi:MAG: hypothetical protein ACOCRO_05525 [Halanaerobiales bacterium]
MITVAATSLCVYVDKEKLKRIIAESETKEEVLLKINSKLIAHKGFELLDDFIKKYHIDTSHFIPEGKKRCYLCGKVKDLSEFPIFNGKHINQCYKCRDKRAKEYVNGIYIGDAL